MRKPPPSLSVLIASFFGVGFAPKAPGTMGTLSAIPLAYGLSKLSPGLWLLGVLGVSLLGIWASAGAGKAFGAVDSGRIVIDEVAGFLLTMLLVPCTLPNLVAGFLLFRLFDIFKPWPASFFDRRVKNAAGVVLDDLAAGVYARLCLLALGWGFPHLFTPA